MFYNLTHIHTHTAICYVTNTFASKGHFLQNNKNRSFFSRAPIHTCLVLFFLYAPKFKNFILLESKKKRDGSENYNNFAVFDASEKIIGLLETSYGSLKIS